MCGGSLWEGSREGGLGPADGRLPTAQLPLTPGAHSPLHLWGARLIFFMYKRSGRHAVFTCTEGGRVEGALAA